MLEVGRIPLLTRAEERELAVHLRETGDPESAKKLVASNLRFVVKMAFEYKNYNIRMTDLVQEGNVGLMHAVSKFDPERGYRLISYAVWWIKAYIQNFIIKNWSMVPISARRKALFGRKKHLPSGESVADAPASAGEGDEASYLVEAEAKRPPRLADARREVALAARDYSLDATIGDDGAATHVARLPAPGPSAEEDYAQAQLRGQVAEVIGRVVEELDDRGRFIVERRLLSDSPMSLAEIGGEFGVSRERARQLEVRVKKKLKKALSHLGDMVIRG